MQKLHFTKMSGAGNDFVLINKERNKALSIGKNFITSICNRKNGIGADGLITISRSDTYDFSMRYYNADGSTGSLCGNGARCAIKFAEINGLTQNGNVKFLSNGKKYSGSILKGNIVKFNLREPKDLKENFHINANNLSITASYMDTGSPHTVIFVEDIKKNGRRVFKKLDDIPVFDLGRKIRYSKYFHPQGSNVNFIYVSNKKIYIRTYERGVENETLACGTGAVAAALIGNLQKKLNSPVTLITKGRDKLFVEFNVLNERFKKLSLTGPAKIVFDGELSLNNLL